MDRTSNGQVHPHDATEPTKASQVMDPLTIQEAPSEALQHTRHAEDERYLQEHPFFESSLASVAVVVAVGGGAWTIALSSADKVVRDANSPLILCAATLDLGIVLSRHTHVPFTTASFFRRFHSDIASADASTLSISPYAFRMRRLKKKGIVAMDDPAVTSKIDGDSHGSIVAQDPRDDVISKKRKQSTGSDDTSTDPISSKKRRRKRPRSKKPHSRSLTPSPITSMSAISTGHISVTPQWLPSSAVARIRQDAEALRAAGAFTQSAIGGREGESQKMALRKRHSECCGLFDDAEAVGKDVGDIRIRDALMGAIADLRETLSATVQPLADVMELQYLFYPGVGNGFYGKHIDQQHHVPGKVHRVISMVLYLNDEHWNSSTDGGALRAYPSPAHPPVDVDPAGGTLVLFDSGKLLHEAKPTQRDRWALVGWFMAAGSA
ncbi:hypothetical protein DYB31_011824 [Aphanomyces astaci]|uniref:Fe2OG dioxygenase domain-containing protein n=2 Tax=Aphanomyces astaci TaxID=112090 RepID=A0A397FE76_APHAT|nr:hypothetical protein DYB31_011824 [Aphanomyces astaci]